MFNATLIGRLTRDPETKATAAGSAYTKFSIAVNNGKDKSGADKPATFIDCSVFGKTGEFVMSYARKGARVCISAAMEVGSYQNKNTGEMMLSVSAMVDTVELIDWPDNSQQAVTQVVAPPPVAAYPASMSAPPIPQAAPSPQKFVDARGEWELHNNQWVLVRPAAPVAPPPMPPAAPSAPPATPWGNSPI